MLHISRHAYPEIVHAAGVTFADQGEHVLKGIADPARVFEVQGQG